ncbi:MAG: molybdenum cofactor guanylyltransferase [Chloroflexi bacterium OHK40]
MHVPGHPPASAIVLAGGQSRRLGRDKRRLRLWGAAGPTLLEHTVATVAALCADVVVVLNDPESWPGLPARLVGDAYPGTGPLGGIASGLAAVAEPFALVVACDMPLLSPSVLTAMLAHPRSYDLLVPRSLAGGGRNAEGIEPLHAIYSRACLAPMEAAIAAGRLQLSALLPELRVAYVEPALLARLDPAGHTFLNLNTPEQLAHLERLLASPAPADRVG